MTIAVDISLYINKLLLLCDLAAHISAISPYKNIKSAVIIQIV